MYNNDHLPVTGPLLVLFGVQLDLPLTVSLAIGAVVVGAALVLTGSISRRRRRANRS